MSLFLSEGSRVFALRRKLSPNMVNDVTARGQIRERFQTTLFPVTTEGRGDRIAPL